MARQISMDDYLSSVSLPELYFTTELMMHICNKSNEYSVQKNPQNFGCRLPTLNYSLLLSCLVGMSRYLVVQCIGRQKRIFTIQWCLQHYLAIGSVSSLTISTLPIITTYKKLTSLGNCIHYMITSMLNA